VKRDDGNSLAYDQKEHVSILITDKKCKGNCLTNRLTQWSVGFTIIMCKLIQRK